MIGREYEINRLEKSLKETGSELIAVYGRRRVGKTHLIRHTYAKHTQFEVTGVYGRDKKYQLQVFHDELKRVDSNYSNKKPPANWHDAFELLKAYIKTLTGKTKKVIFFDEIPWLDTRQSQYLMWFGHFWNTFCEKRKDLIVIVCGSAASYMVQKIVLDRGSLHARLSYKLPMEPFSLYETKKYLEEVKKIKNWGYYDILHLYIALGGIPHYLKKIEKGESVVQNIQRLCFDSKGDLINEFEEIFKSLFKYSQSHIALVRTLGKTKMGISRQKLLKDSGYQASSGRFTTALKELEASGFVTEYPAFGKKTRSLFRLSDEYSYFYLKYIEPNKKQTKDFWVTKSANQSYITWAGFNFETICLKHVEQIKKALGISGLGSRNSSWSVKGTDNKPGALIDLVIDRNDNWINLCEMKFYNKEFSFGKTVNDNIQNKVRQFRLDTSTNKATAITMITTYGVKANLNFTNTVSNSLTMEILFEKM